MGAMKGTGPRARAAIGWACGLLAAAAVQAAPVDVTGSFIHDDDRHVLQLHLATPGSFSARTLSFASGGFAPVLSLFGPGSADPALLQLDVGSAHTCGGAGSGSADPATGFCWDAALDLQLGAGDYTLVLTQDGNTPLGPALSGGFQQDGLGTYTGSQFLGDDSRSFINVDGSARSAAFALRWDLVLDDGRSLPEPGTALALLPALALLAVTRRRRRVPAAGLALAAGLAAGPALALDAPLAADAHISSSTPANNFGALPNLNGRGRGGRPPRCPTPPRTPSRAGRSGRPPGRSGARPCTRRCRGGGRGGPDRRATSGGRGGGRASPSRSRESGTAPDPARPRRPRTPPPALR